MDFNIGDIVVMKKNHPCNKEAYNWKIIKTGADFKIKCLNCQRLVMLSRYNFERRVKRKK